MLNGPARRGNFAQDTGRGSEALIVIQLGWGACKDVMYRCCGVIVLAQCTGLAA